MCWILHKKLLGDCVLDVESDQRTQFTAIAAKCGPRIHPACPAAGQVETWTPQGPAHISQTRTCSTVTRGLPQTGHLLNSCFICGAAPPSHLHGGQVGKNGDHYLLQWDIMTVNRDSADKALRHEALSWCHCCHCLLELWNPSQGSHAALL